MIHESSQHVFLLPPDVCVGKEAWPTRENCLQTRFWGSPRGIRRDFSNLVLGLSGFPAATTRRAAAPSGNPPSLSPTAQNSGEDDQQPADTHTRPDRFNYPFFFFAFVINLQLRLMKSTAQIPPTPPFSRNYRLKEPDLHLIAARK